MVPAEPEKQNLLVGGAAKAAGQAAHSAKAVAQEIAPQSQTSQPPAEYGQEKVETAAPTNSRLRDNSGFAGKDTTSGEGDPVPVGGRG